jgi:hypothetical protein
MPRGGKRENAGRKPGARSKLTVALKATLAETAKQYTVEALQTIADVMMDPGTSASARLAAAGAILERGHGRTPQQLEHSGAIEHKVLTDLELKRRIAFLLSRPDAEEKSE